MKYLYTFWIYLCYKVRKFKIEIFVSSKIKNIPTNSL